MATMEEIRAMTLASYKSQAKGTARDLGYGDAVVKRIGKAKSEAEVCRIMTTARHKLPDWR